MSRPIFEMEDLESKEKEVREPNFLGARGPEGIGGWLLIPAVLPIFWGWNLITGYIEGPGEVEIIGFTAVLIILGILANTFRLLKAKSRHYPKVWIATFCFVWACDVVGALVMDYSEKEMFKTIFGMFPAALIWFTYFNVSKRVYNTFTQ